MNYAFNKVNDVQIAYIGDGSRGWAWTFMTDLSMDPFISGTIRLYDIDEVAAKNNEIIGNHLTERPDTSGKWAYITCKPLEKALTGCDFMVISILPGTFGGMAFDVHLPEHLSIYQSVGDTAGPGGTVRALRTIPMFVEIAKATKAYRPDSWVINYANPTTLCVKTLYHAFPEIKAFDCCHEVFGTQKVLEDIYKETFGLEEIDRHDIFVNVLGINHFTWFDQASYEGYDLFPVYRDYIEEHYEGGYDEPDKNWANACSDCWHRVKFDLFNRFDLIAVAGDRHLAEFMLGAEYLKDPKTVASWNFALTTVNWRKEDLQDHLDRSHRLSPGQEEIGLQPSGEEGILLIRAFCGLERVVSNVNVPNSSLQIPNLPASAVVETNAVFSRGSIKPLIAGTVPDNILNLITPHVENHETVLEAALTCDRELVYKAFSNDPLVRGRASETGIKKLASDMITNTVTYLPEGWKQ